MLQAQNLRKGLIVLMFLLVLTSVFAYSRFNDVWVRGWLNVTNLTYSNNFLYSNGVSINDTIIWENSTGTAKLKSSQDINMQDGDIQIRDSDGEFHNISRDLQLADEMSRNITLTGLRGTLDSAGNLTITTLSGENIVVNIDKNESILNRNTDSIIITSGTNESPILNHIVYVDASNPVLAKRTTLSLKAPSVAAYLQGANFTYASAVGLATSDNLIGGLFNRFFRDGSTYRNGFDFNVSTNIVNITTGVISFLFSEIEIIQNHSTAELYVHVHSDGSFHQHDTLNDCVSYNGGSSVSNNKYFNAVFGIAITHDGTGVMYATTQDEPSTEYTKAIDAEVDIEDTINYFPSDEIVSLAYIPIVRVVMRLSGGVNTIQTLSNGLLYDDLRGTITKTSASPPPSGITAHSDLTNLAWSVAGHTIDTTVEFGNNKLNEANISNSSISASDVGRDIPSNCSTNYAVTGWDDNLSTTYCTQFEEPGDYLINGTDANFGRLGVGTSSPAELFHLNATASASTREKLLIATVSDAPTDAFLIAAGSDQDGKFAPVFLGTREGSSDKAPLGFWAVTNDGNDVGTEPMMAFDAKQFPNGEDYFQPVSGHEPIDTRPLFSFRSDNQKRMQIEANSDTSLYGSPSYALKLRDADDSDNVRIQLSAGNSGGGLDMWDTSESNTVKIRSYASSGIQGWFTAGNIGIGTSTPSELLDVDKSQAGLTSIQVSNTNANAAAAAALQLTSEGGTTYIYRTSDAYASNLNDSLVIQEAGGGDIILFGAAETARFEYGGNVGIGTTTPDVKLDVAGPVHVGVDNGNDLLTISPYTTDNIAYISARESALVGGTTKLAFQVYNAAAAKTAMLIDNTGSVDINDLDGSYTNGEAYVCVYDNGTIFAKDSACS